MTKFCNVEEGISYSTRNGELIHLISVRYDEHRWLNKEFVLKKKVLNSDELEELKEIEKEYGVWSFEKYKFSMRVLYKTFL